MRYFSLAVAVGVPLAVAVAVAAAVGAVVALCLSVFGATIRTHYEIEWSPIGSIR